MAHWIFMLAAWALTVAAGGRLSKAMRTAKRTKS